ncbi:MAG: cytochrome c [Gammaproteobacteria bacterium]|nr:MAG: cytochrome c [Gammaproteobacteria bacterium]
MNKLQRENAHYREKPEPHEATAGVPRYIQALIVLAVLWGGTYIITNPYERVWQVQAATEAPAQLDGEQVFNNNCVACHQVTGLGVPSVFPPLARSEWVVGDPRIPVRIILHGLSGEVSVAGATYNGYMPAFGSSLENAEIAALVSFIRGKWGNSASPVSAEIVADERTSHQDRIQPWTTAELKDLVGVP